MTPAPPQDRLTAIVATVAIAIMVAMVAFALYGFAALIQSLV